MADSVEDDDKWLYSSSDPSAEMSSNVEPKDSNGSDRRQSEDLSQIFENQSSDDFRQLFEVSNPTEEPNSSQNLDQSMDELKEEKDFGFESNEKDMNDNNDNDSDEDDDEDDDDVQVTIGDIKANTTAFPYGSTPMNLNITKRSANFASGQTSVANKPKAGLDIDAVGIINGVPIYDVNLDSLEEKPWRKPGADITDYFNYGFNEEMWKQYCERQKKLRNHDFGQTNGPPPTARPTPSSIAGAPPGGAVPPGGKPGAEQTIPIASVNENSKYTGIGLTKKAGPPPGRKQSGTIDVIGGGTPTTPSMLPSRRPPDTKENFIQVIGNRPPGPPGPPPPGLPPGMPFPPPGMSMPPPFFPPPGVEFPPGMPPPPGMPMIAPNGQPIPFPPGDFPPMRFPHPGMLSHPDHHFDEQSDGFHDGMRGSPNEGRDDERERERERSERDYHRSSRGYSREFRDDESYRSGRSGHYREHRDREERDYEHHERSRDRDFDKDYESRRHREKERERDTKDKDRDKDTRDSSRRVRHREEHDYEDDHNSRSSSRHKHSKRSKRDKEEEEKETKH